MTQPQPREVTASIDALLAKHDETTAPDPGELWLSPDCRDGNHNKCDGIAWDLDEDALCSCGCTCGCDE